MAGEIDGRAIFISYRRDDSEGEAGRLYDDLVRAYGDDSVFMDVAGIEPGLDFRKAIDANVATCGVLLAVIGPTWTSVADSSGNRRLENPNDFVRLEIASALARSTAVIPVLVHGAKMPPLDELPDDLKDLRYRNSVELTHARWNSDVSLLVTALKNYVTVARNHETETVHATIPVQLPPPNPAPADSPRKKSRLPLVLGFGAVALVILAVGLYTALQSGGSSPQVKQVQSASGGGAPASSIAAAQNSVSGQPVAQPVAARPATVNQSPLSSDSALLGKWQNAKQVTVVGELAQLTVADFGGQTMVHAWGKCQDRLCDWGTKSAKQQGSAVITEVWELRNTEREVRNQRSASISLTPNADGLQVAVKNTYHPPDGQDKVVFTQLQFVRKP